MGEWFLPCVCVLRDASSPRVKGPFPGSSALTKSSACMQGVGRWGSAFWRPEQLSKFLGLLLAGGRERPSSRTRAPSHGFHCGRGMLQERRPNMSQMGVLFSSNALS